MAAMAPASGTPGEVILLTGATGFVGKAALLTLLRDASISRVIVIMRLKSGQSLEGRLATLLASSCFSEQLDSVHIAKVYAVRGDIETPRFGATLEDYNFLATTITAIIHCAASVDFDLPIAAAVKANVDGALNVLELAQACGSRLRRLVYCSTAYSTPPTSETIRAELAQHPPTSALHNPEACFSFITEFHGGRASADRACPGDMESKLLASSGHPNTYTFSKCLAELLVASRRGDVRLTIARPSIVGAAVRSPFPAGWIARAGWLGWHT